MIPSSARIAIASTRAPAFAAAALWLGLATGASAQSQTFPNLPVPGETPQTAAPGAGAGGGVGGGSAPGSAPVGAAVPDRNWVNPDVIALREEVARLGREVARLRGGGVAPSGEPGKPIGADAYVRLDALEVELRGLVGRLEQVEFAVQRVQNEQAQRLNDLSLRLRALEQAAGVSGGADPNDPNAVGLDPNDPNAIGLDPNDPNAVGGAPAPGGGVAAAGVGGSIGGGGAAVGGATVGAGAGVGAPPRSLGTIPGSGAAAPAGGGSTQFGGRLATPGAGAANPNADAALRTAINAVRTGGFAEAETQLKGFLAQNPTHPRAGEAKHWLGETYFVRQRYQEAATTFLSSFREHPNGSKAPDSLLRLGMTLAQLNQRAEACLTFSEVGKKYPNAPLSTRRQAQVEARRNGCR